MLVLTRKPDQQIQIGENIRITIVRVKGQSVRIGIEAPQEVRVMRTELTVGEEAQAATHLTSCAECHENLRRLQRVLAVVDESALAGPELPAHFEVNRS